MRLNNKNEVFILGKPNVGKSSLFNAIIEKKLALVENLPGLTRDIRSYKVKFLDYEFFLFDTAGISKNSDKFSAKIFEHTFNSIKENSIILFVVEAKKCLTSEDFDICGIIRKLNKKIILVINKSEGKVDQNFKDDCSKLGLGEAVFTSSAHKIGIYDLKLRIIENFNKSELTLDKTDEKDFHHSISIVGRPNTGKSTLINSLKGSKVSLTDSSPNLTRDPVETNLIWNDLKFKVFDTAGIAENSKKLSKIEKISVFETKRKIRLSELIILTLDINNYYENFNRKLIRLVVQESRCLVIVINKIDSKKEFSEKYIKKQIYESFPQINNVPIFFVSAILGIGLNELMMGILDILPRWKLRISTNKLNSWLYKIMRENAPPLFKGREVKLKYMTQASIRPPKFIIFTNYPDSLKESYKRFLINDIKKTFNFEGIIIKLTIKKSINPYE